LIRSIFKEILTRVLEQLRAADHPVRILGSRESGSRSVRKKHLKLVHEELKRVMPNEIEKLVSELQRDIEIVALIKTISDECKI
jgi:hypothetical protein